MRLSVVCLSPVGYRSTQNGSGLLLSLQPLYAIAKVRKKLTNILKILFFLCILNMLNFKRLALIAVEIQSDETKRILDQYHQLTQGMLVLEF